MTHTFIEVIDRYMALGGWHQECVDLYFEGKRKFENLPRPSQLFIEFYKQFNRSEHVFTAMKGTRT